MTSTSVSFHCGNLTLITWFDAKLSHRSSTIVSLETNLSFVWYNKTAEHDTKQHSIISNVKIKQELTRACRRQPRDESLLASTLLARKSVEDRISFAYSVTRFRHPFPASALTWPYRILCRNYTRPKALSSWGLPVLVHTTLHRFNL